MKFIRTCVQPDGHFVYGVHKPRYMVSNLRETTHISTLGIEKSTSAPVANDRNFPAGTIEVDHADWIFEIPNPLPFKGATYIDKEWADASAANPQRITIPKVSALSLTSFFQQQNLAKETVQKLPRQILLAVAATSNDEAELSLIAEVSCDFVKDKDGIPAGLHYQKSSDGSLRPIIHDHILFEAIANNPHLPDAYKIAMVIRPGAQGGSEIVGEWPQDGATHVYEYLRRNSYIAGGHYAANMAEDAIRYSIEHLQIEDMHGLRHLYTQRIFVVLAQSLNLPLPAAQRRLSEEELETLRLNILAVIQSDNSISASLWGWNFGFDYAPTGYRLHASHQQIHQQYALVPKDVEAFSGGKPRENFLPAFSCGDMIAEVIEDYQTTYHSDFFSDYRLCIENNRRMDKRQDLENSLVIWRDKNVMLFVPKAQTSQWEVQIMTLPDSTNFLPGNILECSPTVRSSLNKALLYAQKALAALGAQMVTSIEYSKRFASRHSQPLIYALLPRLPESPGAFSEAQLRFINGHYPEDFAAACRNKLKMLNLL